MFKIYLNVDGMMCSMCEAHINDIVRKNYKIKKVKSSRKKKLTIIEMENSDFVDKIIDSIKSLGYECSLNKIEEN